MTDARRQRQAFLQKRRRQASQDPDAGRCGGDKTARIDLGLAIMRWHTSYGVRRTQEEIATFCGCTSGFISLIERQAMQKLRARLRVQKDPLLAELVGSLFGGFAK